MIIKAYELAQKLVLEPAARYLGLPLTGPRHSILELDKTAVTQLLRIEGEGKIYIFSFGYAVIMGFSDEETFLLLRSVRLLLGLAPESPAGAAMDSLDLSEIQVSEKFTESSLVKAAPVLLARSMALRRESALVAELIDESEPFIINLKKSHSWINGTMVRKVASRLIRFQADLVHTAGLLNTHAGFTTGQDIDACTAIADYIGLAERVQSHREKLNQLKNLLNVYIDSRLSSTLIRSYWMEVILLSIFPLPHFFPLKEMILGVINWIYALFS